VTTPSSDPQLQARAAAAREVLAANPGFSLSDRLDLLSQVVWPSPELEAYYGASVASSGLLPNLT
jgi:hypothetical protein